MTAENDFCWACRDVTESCHVRAFDAVQRGEVTGYPGDKPCCACGVNHWPRCGEPVAEDVLRRLQEKLVRRHCFTTGEDYQTVSMALNDALGVFSVNECTEAMLWQRWELARQWFGSP